MKHILKSSALILIFLTQRSANAQLNKGSFMLNLQTFGNQNSTQYLNPGQTEYQYRNLNFSGLLEFQYFFLHNTSASLGSGANFTRNSSEYTFGIPESYSKTESLGIPIVLGIKRYFPLKDKIYFFGGLQFIHQRSRTRSTSEDDLSFNVETSKSTSKSANLQSGIMWLPLRNFGLTFGLNLLAYSQNKYQSDSFDRSSNSSNFSLNNNLQLNLGFSYLLRD